MKEMKPCFQCGSPPMDSDWDTVTEYSGIAEQAATIYCSGELKKDCPVDVSIKLDRNVEVDSAWVGMMLKKMWNALSEPAMGKLLRSE